MAETDDRDSRGESQIENSAPNNPAADAQGGKWDWMQYAHLAPAARVEGSARCAPTSVRVEARSCMTVVVAAGDIDLYTAPQLLDPLIEIAESPMGSAVVVDLRAVQFMDSVGMRALISAHKSLRNAQRPFALLTVPRSQPDRQVCLVGLDRVVLRVSDLDEIPWSLPSPEQSNSFTA